MVTFLWSFVTAFLISLGVTPLVIKLARTLNLIDDPKTHHHPKVIHTYPVPRGGGLACFIALCTTAILFLPLDKHLIGILIGALLLTLMGLWDDKHNLNPYLRFILQFIIAGIPIAAGIGIAFIKLPVVGMIELSQPQITFELLGKTRSLWVLSDAFGLIWIVFLMNILNLGAKGVDGQLSGVVGISALTIAFLSLRFSADITQWPVIILALILAGAYLGFLPWHLYPQKIMPSYSGSILAGYMLGILSILSTAKVGTLLVTLGVPLIDTGYVIIRRLVSGQSPVWGDRGHLHHRLLDIGWSKPQVAAFYWIITAVLGLLALKLNASQKLYTMLGLAVLIGGLILLITQKKKTT